MAQSTFYLPCQQQLYSRLQCRLESRSAARELHGQSTPMLPSRFTQAGADSEVRSRGGLSFPGQVQRKGFLKSPCRPHRWRVRGCCMEKCAPRAPLTLLTLSIPYLQRGSKGQSLRADTQRSHSPRRRDRPRASLVSRRVRATQGAARCRNFSKTCAFQGALLAGAKAAPGAQPGQAMR